jgi:hypothetical protein
MEPLAAFIPEPGTSGRPMDSSQRESRSLTGATAVLHIKLKQRNPHLVKAAYLELKTEGALSPTRLRSSA